MPSTAEGPSESTYGACVVCDAPADGWGMHERVCEMPLCETHWHVPPRIVGQRLWFDYHCWEDHASGDAALWYRSRQPVTVMERHRIEDPEFALHCYQVRFADGHVGPANEDELSDQPIFDPAYTGPPSHQEIAAHDAEYAAWAKSNGWNPATTR